MTNMEIYKKKTGQLFGQMKTRLSSNMEMESHILGTPNLRRKKNTILKCYNLFFVNVNVNSANM